MHLRKGCLRTLASAVGAHEEMEQSVGSASEDYVDDSSAHLAQNLTDLMDGRLTSRRHPFGAESRRSAGTSASVEQIDALAHIDGLLNPRRESTGGSTSVGGASVGGGPVGGASAGAVSTCGASPTPQRERVGGSSLGHHEAGTGPCASARVSGASRSSPALKHSASNSPSKRWHSNLHLGKGVNVERPKLHIDASVVRNLHLPPPTGLAVETHYQQPIVSTGQEERRAALRRASIQLVSRTLSGWLVAGATESHRPKSATMTEHEAVLVVQRRWRRHVMARRVLSLAPELAPASPPARQAETASHIEFAKGALMRSDSSEQSGSSRVAQAEWLAKSAERADDADRDQPALATVSAPAVAIPTQRSATPPTASANDLTGVGRGAPVVARWCVVPIRSPPRRPDCNLGAGVPTAATPVGSPLRIGCDASDGAPTATAPFVSSTVDRGGLSIEAAAAAASQEAEVLRV